MPKTLNIDMTYKEFAADLFWSYDLDPEYPAAAYTIQDDDMRKRFVLGYGYFYHLGCAAAVAEQPSHKFFKACRKGVEAKWPRGRQHRHWRGIQAHKTLDGLELYRTPEKVIDTMLSYKTFPQADKAMAAFPFFGPGTRWKMADMGERILQLPIKFPVEGSSYGIFKGTIGPRTGASFILTGDSKNDITDEQLNSLIYKMMGEFKNMRVPPYQDRAPNIQEIETLFCKYKAHCYGGYPLGDDSFLNLSEPLQVKSDLGTQMALDSFTYLRHLDEVTDYEPYTSMLATNRQK
jgi:hypothetical protein